MKFIKTIITLSLALFAFFINAQVLTPVFDVNGKQSGYSNKIDSLIAKDSAVVTFQNKSVYEFNRDIDTQNLIDTAAALRNNINYVASNTGSARIYYVDNRWKMNGGTRSSQAYLNQLMSAERGSILHAYPTIWAARNAAVRDSATVPEPLIHILGGVHTIGLTTTGNSDTLDYVVEVGKRTRAFLPNSSDSSSPALNYNRLSYSAEDGTTIRTREPNIRLFNDNESRSDSFTVKNISFDNKSGLFVYLIKSSFNIDANSITIAGGDKNIIAGGGGQNIINVGTLKCGGGGIGSYWTAGKLYGRQRPNSIYNFKKIIIDSTNQGYNLITNFEQRNITSTYNIGDFIADGTDVGLLRIGWNTGSPWGFCDSSNVTINLNRFYQRYSFLGTSETGLIMAQTHPNTTYGSKWNINIVDIDAEMPLCNGGGGGGSFNKDTLFLSVKSGVFVKKRSSQPNFCDFTDSDANTVITLTGNYEIKNWTNGIVIPSTFLGKVILDNCYIKSNNDIPLIVNNSATAKVILRNTTLVVGGAATNSITGTGSVIVESARSNAPVLGTITQKGSSVLVSTDFNY